MTKFKIENKVFSFVNPSKMTDVISLINVVF